MLIDQLEYAQVRASLQGPCGATLNDGAWVSADVGMRLIVPFGLDRTAKKLLHPFAYFSPLNCILMSVTCSNLKHQKLTKTFEKDTAKGITNIS